MAIAKRPEDDSELRRLQSAGDRDERLGFGVYLLAIGAVCATAHSWWGWIRAVCTIAVSMFTDRGLTWWRRRPLRGRLRHLPAEHQAVLPPQLRREGGDYVIKPLLQELRPKLSTAPVPAPGPEARGDQPAPADPSD
jgi:hypothetical protein